MSLQIVQVQDGRIAIIDDLGNIIGITAAPLRVDPTGTTTQPISNPNLDVLLSTRASQATLAAVAASVASIEFDFDVALSTRASQATAAAAAASLASLDADVDVPLSTRAAESTLSTRATQVTAAAIQSVLEAIRDTAGVKKITDPLPAGTNHIGAVLVDNAAGAAAVNVQDGGNVLTVDGSAVTGVPAGGVLNIQGVDVVASAVALGALNAAATITINGQQGAGFQLAAGTLVGTIVAEASYDAGTTWNQIPFWNQTTQAFLDNLVFGAVNTATALSILVPSGASSVRVRVSAYSAGTANATVRGSNVRSPVSLVATLDGYKGTYSAAITGLVFAAAATDIFTISGSASRTVRLVSVSMSGTQTVATRRAVRLVKRSTANTGGASTAPTVVPHDSADPPGTAVVTAYTTNPTLGTLIGLLRARRAMIDTTGPSGVTVDETLWEFGMRNTKAGVLRGVAESISINMNGVTSSGNECDLYAEWTEEG